MLAERHGKLADYSVQTPGNLEDVMPFHKISVVRGQDDTVTDTTVVDIETFARSWSQAAEEAEAIRTAMLSMAGKTDEQGRWLIDSVSTISRPVWVDYRNPAIQRFIGTYQLAMRPVMV